MKYFDPPDKTQSVSLPSSKREVAPVSPEPRYVCRICGKTLDPMNCLSVWQRHEGNPPAKRLIGYECFGHERESQPVSASTEPDVELISAKVHEQWMESKRERGIYSRKSESGEELMVPYDQLSEAAKELDRGALRAVLNAMAAGSAQTPPALSKCLRDHMHTPDKGCWEDRPIEQRLQERVAKAQPAKEEKLRELLWMRHGCVGLYGDDGEMQCGKCGLDFKRDPVDVMEARFRMLGMAQIVAAQTGKAKEDV